MVGHDVVVVREFFMADCAHSFLFDNLPVQEFPHLCWGSQFAIPPWVMRVFYTLDTELHLPFLPNLLPSAAEPRSMDWAVFIPTESHKIAPCHVPRVWLVIVNLLRKVEKRGQ